MCKNALLLVWPLFIRHIDRKNRSATARLVVHYYENKSLFSLIRKKKLVPLLRQLNPNTDSPNRKRNYQKLRNFEAKYYSRENVNQNSDKDLKQCVNWIKITNSKKLSAFAHPFRCPPFLRSRRLFDLPTSFIQSAPPYLFNLPSHLTYLI